MRITTKVPMLIEEPMTCTNDQNRIKITESTIISLQCETIKPSLINSTCVFRWTKIEW
jgi:hypothetical protein